MSDEEQCNTCGGTGRWESTTEDSPTTLVDLGPCPDCDGAAAVVRYLRSWIHGSMGWADDADVEALVAACRLIEAAYPKARGDE